LSAAITLCADLLAPAGEYNAKWFDPPEKPPMPLSPNTAGADAAGTACGNSMRPAINAVRGQKKASVTEESKPTTQTSPQLFDSDQLLQREAFTQYFG
jgi:DNA topoisomerase-3